MSQSEKLVKGSGNLPFSKWERVQPTSLTLSLHHFHSAPFTLALLYCLCSLI